MTVAFVLKTIYLVPNTSLQAPFLTHAMAVDMTEIPCDLEAAANAKKIKRRSRRWTKDEDSIICEFMNNVVSKGKWSIIARRLPQRTGKQCRERWYNQVCPQKNLINITHSQDFT